MKRIQILGLFILLSTFVLAQKKSDVVVYKLNLKDMVAPAMWRNVQRALLEAKEKQADVFLIEMNTYGGLVESADSIRTALLNLDIPTLCFINNNAASAGALIAISCDSIYMRPGSSFGAATVVNQTGEAMPDKYQSYMRSTMRATAEAHGKKAVVVHGDTTWVWQRDPAIAEAMVDSRLVIPGLIDSTKVLTFTPSEAIANGFCEGMAENSQEVLNKAGYSDYTIVEYHETNIDRLIGWLMSPYFQSILIMIMIGGIYFELQSPGIGFPLAASVVAALLYFAPLYLEGIASNVEVIIFIIGLILLTIEIFAIPGFGVTGISGIVLMVSGLALGMVDNVEFELSTHYFTPVLRAFAIVMGNSFVALVIMLFTMDKVLGSSAFSFITLHAKENKSEGFLSFDTQLIELVGKEGETITILRPSGKIKVGKKMYDAVSEFSYILKNTPIIVSRFENGQLYVVKKDEY
jgi:membrane-bound serine protease (ClpP class)